MLPDPSKLFEDSPFNQISASIAQMTARKLLALDVEADPRRFQLDNKLVQIQIDDLNLNYFVRFNEGQISITNTLPSEPSEISALIRGNLKAFVAAATAEHSGDAVFTGDLTFTGEINTAKKFQAFAQSLDIDWQEPFAQVLGDPLGHTLTGGISHLSSWLQTTLHSVKLDIADYLSEESKVTPSENELRDFYQNVDQIRSQTDRLNARLTRLLSLTKDSSKKQN